MGHCIYYDSKKLQCYIHLIVHEDSKKDSTREEDIP